MSISTEQDKREKILNATEAVLAEEGFQGISMQKIAKNAGVAAGTIYRYFEDKDHLLKEIRFRVTKRIADHLQANVSETMPIKERYQVMWLNLWNLARDNCFLLSNRVQYDSLPKPSSSEEWQQEREMFHKVELTFNEGKESGLFKPLDNRILFGLSLEVGVTLARKHSLGIIHIDDETLDAAIAASWDAIIQH
ncbi:TetR/AcrR family transcriptional regulator [Vibrio tapetis]|uniref:TetR family transcriptional regulator n=1 Tax=Vibrio tapetis subsp. tapetis TaxID=1671868 RepID=A0A2N8ZH06_9VIBR|nr:TetR/AcrR family transcriptional regulator [Vibrio tapetis]SON51165.1 TetR family transcriptional regulator [Vibrio tapetis subsp. tapetis]